MNHLFNSDPAVRQAIGGGFGRGGFNGVREITGNDTVLKSDNGKVLHVTSNATLTFDNNSPEFVYIEADGATVTLAATGLKTLEGEPLVFEDGTSVIVYRDETVHRVMGSGEINTNSNAGSTSDGVGLVLPKSGSDTPIKRITAAIGSGRFIESTNAITYMKDGDYMPGVETYQSTSGMSGDIEVIDDLFALMMGYSDSASLRGTSWDQLSEDIFTSKLVTGYVLLSAYNAGSGTSVYPLKGSMVGTINGSMAWGADGFTFDGANDNINCGSEAVITGAVEWTAIAVARQAAAGGTGRVIMSKNNGTANRINFLQFETDGSIASFHNDGTTSRTAKTAISESDADDRIFMSRMSNAAGFQVFKDTAVTAPGTQTIAVTPRTIQNTNFIIGSSLSGGGTGWYNDRIRFVFLFSGSIDVGDKNKLRTGLNNIFGLAIQS